MSMWKPRASLRAEKPWRTAWAQNENNVLHGDHYEIEGVIDLKPNARVCMASDADRFPGNVCEPDQREVKADLTVRSRTRKIARP